MSQAALSYESTYDRETIATNLYRNVPTRSRNLLVSLLSRSFVDELLDAVEERRSPNFAQWAEQMASRPGRAQAIEAVLQAADTLPEYLLEHGMPQTYVDTLRSLDHPISTQAAAELEQQAYEYSDRLNEIDSAIAKLLVRLGEANPHSAEHAREVSAWCKRLGRRLSLSEKATTFVERCGLLHNVGELEVEHTKESHVLAGERIVRSSAAVLAQFAPVIRGQHEALDGSGTPDGLRGEAIDMATRIVSVACAFNDAITGRTGRAPLSVRAAADALTMGCGKRYDVTVVAALVGLTSGM
jgi:HD-GYP domain-containing protein (c-di-GMP phosphodiesterase class II)